MKVRVRAFATIREAIGTGQTDLELPDDSNVRSLIEQLSKMFGDQFKKLILVDGERLAPYVKILVNGRDIEYLNKLDTKLKHMDEVAIIPPVAGGIIKAK